MKNIRIALILCAACLMAVGCRKDEVNEIRTYSSDRFKVQIEPFKDNDSKAYLNYTDALSRIIYENGDKIQVNGREYTMSYEDGVWLATGSAYTGEKFYAAYCDGTLNTWDSAAGPKYNFNINTYIEGNTHNKIILAGTSDDNYVLTLRPACAILRVYTGNSGSSWTNVRVGFEGGKIPATGTIAPSTQKIYATSYLEGVSQGSGGVVNGDFMAMRWSKQSSAAGNHASDESGYWYVAIPIGDASGAESVTTTLYLGWNNGVSEIQYKTQGQVELRKGYVYTLGAERVSPFTAKGASNGLFNVAAGRQVRFSAGNLQTMRTINPATGNYTYKWQFANHQYGIVGGVNGTNIQNNDEWFDLFGYGTSGYNAGQTARMPNSTSTTASDYIATAIANTSSDWGSYLHTYANYKLYYGTTEVSSENWRTLTSDEWTYLINRTGKSGLATVSGTQGLILLPDYFPGGWALPDGVSFTATFSNYTTNSYDATNWDKLESAGAIFLPVTGYRNGTSVNNSYNGYYWSTSAPTSERGNPAPALVINGSTTAVASAQRFWGCAVRLVVQVEEE